MTEHNGCVGCAYDYRASTSYPCNVCKQNYKDRYSRKRGLTKFEKLAKAWNKTSTKKVPNDFIKFIVERMELTDSEV